MHHGEAGATPTAATTAATTAAITAAIRAYAAHPLFQHNDTALALDNPYRRALPIPEDGPGAAAGDPGALLCSDDGLFANRVLLSIYERDFVLLPRDGFAAKRADFSAYYGPELTERGDRIRPHLEARSSTASRSRAAGRSRGSAPTTRTSSPAIAPRATARSPPASRRCPIRGPRCGST
jgi:hypothetical protein